MTPVESYSATCKIVTQGDTATPTRVKIVVNRNAESRSVVVPAAPVRVRVVNDNSYANATNATIAASNGSIVLETPTATKDLVVSPVVAVAASGVLTISGVVKHGETVTIGARVYEFVAKAGYTTVNVPVDIAAGTTAATGTLTLDTQPTAGDIMVVGDQTYTFVALGTGNAVGEIALGANLAATQPLVVAAINGTDGWNTANAKAAAAAFASDDCVITSFIEGTASNLVATTSTFTAGTNQFAAVTLLGGTDCAAPAAVTALAAEIIEDVASVVSAVDGAGNTIDVTHKVVGNAGEAVATTETLSNGAWGAAHLTAGEDADKGSVYVDITNATTAPVDILVGSAPFGPALSLPARLTIRHAAV